MLELKLMNSLGEFTKTVNVEENSLVIINVVSGDWVMVEPCKVDADIGHRNISIYDGSIRFLATKNNVAKVNSMVSPFDLLEEFGNEEINEGWT